MSQPEPLMSEAERKRDQKRIDRLDEQISQYAVGRSDKDPFLIRLRDERYGLFKKLEADDIARLRYVAACKRADDADKKTREEP